MVFLDREDAGGPSIIIVDLATLLIALVFTLIGGKQKNRATNFLLFFILEIDVSSLP